MKTLQHENEHQPPSKFRLLMVLAPLLVPHSSLFELLPEMIHTLREVDFDAPIVYQDIVHLEVGLFTCRITKVKACSKRGYD